MAKETKTCNTIEVERDDEEEAPLSELVSKCQVIAVYVVDQTMTIFI